MGNLRQDALCNLYPFPSSEIFRKTLGWIYAVRQVRSSRSHEYGHFLYFECTGTFACAKLHIFERYDYILGNTIAFLLSVLWSFYWNSRYVFGLEEGEKRSPWKALLKTYISYGFTGIILSNILSYVWIRVFGISKYLAPLINLVVSIPVNFLMNKLWAFKEEKTEA